MTEDELLEIEQWLADETGLSSYTPTGLLRKLVQQYRMVKGSKREGLRELTRLGQEIGGYNRDAE